MDYILPWFILKSVPGIGNLLFKRLIDRFHSPEIIFETSHKDLVQVEGVTSRLADRIKHHKVSDSVKRDLDLVVQKGYQIVTMTDSDYPSLLRHIPDPPPFLYVFGRLDNSFRNIAIVGSRNATRYGILTTRRLCYDLAQLQMTIVSGMALGIDSAAHEGALMGGGNTIAVLGSGLEYIYPSQNRKLFYRIAENGAVISEFPLKTEPDAHNFPRRNRIISGISLGTVVVEATKRSGSLITAHLAAEQNREVFAVPGSIQSFKSTGTHTLIKQGAKLVEHARDIMEELSHVIKTPDENDKFSDDTIKKKPLLSDDETIVSEALEPYPVHIDDLARMLSMEPGKLSSILLQLELKGMALQSAGKFFSKTEENE
ncbi:MAG: DNA-processing protein DprA [Desulfobacterales bacterium]|nr:DNA-processing protein DprA [Desulfobacterales bacterium]